MKEIESIGGQSVEFALRLFTISWDRTHMTTCLIMIENIISDAADIQKFIMAEPRDKTPRIEAVDMAFVLLKYIILGGISLASLWIISGTVILIATGRFLSIPAPVDINIIIPLVSSATTLILGYLFGKKE